MKRENSKLKQESNTEIAEVSQSLIDAIKKDIAKFNSYWDFLYSVDAMVQNGDTQPRVLKYKNEEMGNYESKFVKKYTGNSINGAFVFEKYASFQKNIAREGKAQWVDTGYFIPRMFWDFIEKQRMNFEDYKEIPKMSHEEIIQRIKRDKEDWQQKITSHKSKSYGDIIESRNKAVDFLQS